MRKAKENVEKHYAVVGVLEELNKTLTVLEHYVPRFFKGAKDVYWSKCHLKIPSLPYSPPLFQTRSRSSRGLTGTSTSRRWRR